MKTTHDSSLVRRLPVAPLAAALGFMLAVAPAVAQLTPDRTYYGVKRPAPMKVAVPTDTKGEATIKLFDAGSDKAAASASVAAGSVDLASLFPTLWTTDKPKVQYAQLFVGEKAVGAPVVLQPLVSPPMARSVQGRVQFDPMPGPLSGVRAYVEKHAVLTTSLGEMEFAFRPDQAPNTVWNFLDLVKGGYYTDIIFHRVMGEKNGKPGFMAQVGDPTGTGGGGPGYNIDLEDSKLPHDFGVLSMARTNDPNTGGSQVFACLSREGTSFLDGNYCAFAQLVGGAETLVKIGQVPCQPGGEGSKPIDPPKIISAKLVDAPPYGTGPKPASKPATK
jgi:peptidyl-prolyl cis-trans isomerase B (cyclophilin B)